MTRTRRAQVTLADVARAARVSTMTVSNVLNGVGRASDDTRMRVRAAAEALGYVPNLSASRLTGSGLSRVGVLYGAGDSSFLTTLIAAIATEAAARGLQLLLRPTDTREAATAFGVSQELIKRGAEAILFVPPYAEMLDLSQREALGLPIAGIVTANPIVGMATARIDNRTAARALTSLLLGQGHTRVGVIAGPLDHSDSVARLEGHRMALDDQGIDHDLTLEAVGTFEFASGISNAQRLLDHDPPPTAIVAANDEMAAGVLWAANSRGLRVPDDLAVCGFDDTLLATRVWPTLTTIRQPLRAMAGEALDALQETYRRPSVNAPTTRDSVLPFELIERSSTGRGTDPAPRR